MSRFRKCVLPGTPSLKTLIELPIGIVAAVRPPRPLLGEPDVEPRRDEPVGALLADRKSTRLNSSHGYISYAVFCLKKKTYIMLDRPETRAIMKCANQHCSSVQNCL